jgi:UDP-3-O-[3-hydroxymyristoyl] glucosamine N-acyltransferase
VTQPRIRLADLAQALSLPLEGDADVVLSGVAPLDRAGPSDLSFIRSPAFAEALAASRAGALVALHGIDVSGRPTLRSADPSADFYRAARLLVPEPAPAPGRHATAVVAPDADVDASASLGPGCCVGAGAKVGARSVLHAGVVMYPGASVGNDCVLHAGVVVAAASRLGDRVICHPGVVIGSEGFGYVGAPGGGLERAHHIGRVLVEDDVEIGANSTIDRGTLGDTRIGRGTKIDNLVQVGHNCQIGERVVIVAQAGIAGSTTLEDDCVILAQAGVAGHLRVGSRAVVGPQCGVHKDVPPGTPVLGSPQREHLRYHREMAALSRLPDLLRRMRALERKLAGGEET